METRELDVPHAWVVALLPSFDDIAASAHDEPVAAGLLPSLHQCALAASLDA